MQGVRTVYSTTWEEKTRKATNPVSQIHSTPFGRHRQHDWPGQAVWIGTGSLWLEEARSRLLCSRPMMMTDQLPQQSTTLGSRHAPHGTTIFTMPNSHVLKSWHLCPLWYRSSERSYWTLTDKIGLNFVIFSDSNRQLTSIHQNTGTFICGSWRKPQTSEADSNRLLQT